MQSNKYATASLQPSWLGNHAGRTVRVRRPRRVRAPQVRPRYHDVYKSMATPPPRHHSSFTLQRVNLERLVFPVTSRYNFGRMSVSFPPPPSLRNTISSEDGVAKDHRSKVKSSSEAPGPMTDGLMKIYAILSFAIFVAIVFARKAMN